jgi:hypothetical protein
MHGHMNVKLLINISVFFLRSVEQMSVQCSHEVSTALLELPYARSSQFVSNLDIYTV